jgi:hypothetical protein
MSTPNREPPARPGRVGRPGAGALAIFAAAWTVSCTPKLDDVCELYAGEHTNEGDYKGVTTDRARAECLARMGPLQASDPKRYRCEARCMMKSGHAVADRPEIDDCKKNCGAP